MALTESVGEHLLDAVQDGSVPLTRLDDMARRWATRLANASSVLINTSLRILLPWYASNQHLDYPAPNFQKWDLSDQFEQDGMVFRNEHVDNRGDGHILARKIAAESTVYASAPWFLPALTR